ncbi:MAG: carbohydrate-binding domain-containing protein, partial [Lachnospiraceae bacterium]|nr:carbohydrate-binding domain-containing protein [Lachnospiraceae bacterium]
MFSRKYIGKICGITILILAAAGVLYLFSGLFGRDGDAVRITLNGTKISVSGKGAAAEDGGVRITSGGSYLITGTLDDGNIIVDADRSDKVYLTFDGVNITCDSDACLRVEQADKVVLTLSDGTENSLTGGETMPDEAQEDKVSGGIFTRDDLTIGGNGSLTVTSGCRHGITAKDDLEISGGSIRVTAPQDGIHVNDSFRFSGASLRINVSDDAIHSDTDVRIESGQIRIDRCYEGIEAPNIDISGGEISIRSDDDGINADQEISVSGGFIEIVVDSAEDADGLDSNGDIRISGGNLRISLIDRGFNCALDYGMEKNGTMEITGGTVIACGSRAMAEAFSDTSTQTSVLYNTSETR